MNETSKPIAIFMLGLPGSGKSTAVEKYRKLDYVVVSADYIRVNHPSYDQSDPEALHEESVKLAELDIYAHGKLGMNVVMDGTGINDNYTPRIINKMKELGYYIIVHFVDTPEQVCVSRNLERMKKGERFVPIHVILDKSARLNKCKTELMELADQFETFTYFTNEVIFVDMDGTVAEYQRLVKDINGNIDFVNYDVFKNPKPVNQVINKLENFSKLGKKICILSASPNSICNNHKLNWIKEHMPFIKEEDIFFCGNKDFKHVMIEQLIKYFDTEAKNIMAIDDDHKILESYDRLCINAVHPSFLLTNY